MTETGHGGGARYRHLQVTAEGGVGRIVIDRPEVRNALNEEATGELVRAIDTLGADPGVKVILLRGAGTDAFCAGADLKELADRRGVLERREYFHGIGAVVRALHRVPVPVAAMVYGYALAGGCGLAAAWDMAYAADDAVFGLPELHVGLFPMMVMAPILRSAGRKKAMEMLFTGRRYSADDAESMGLITGVFPSSDLEDAVEGILADVARFSPAVLRLGKGAAAGMDGMSFRRAMDYLQETIAIAAATEDADEGISAFLEKRRPRWRGR